MKTAIAEAEVQKQAPPRHELVGVPRSVLSKYQEATWADLLAAAKRGDDGLYLTNSKAFGVSYFRAPDKGGTADAVGSPSLFCQGWVKAS